MTLPPAFLDRPIAHRGLHDRDAGVIENSRAAFAAAIAGGYGIELDLQLSADGEAMVFHDHELDRLTGETGFVRHRTAAELGAIPLKGAADGGGAPTLAEVLALVAGRAPLLVEIKDQSARLTETDGRLERRAAELLSAYDGLAAVMSFNPHAVAHLRDAAPAIPRGRVTCTFGQEDWAFVPPARRAALAAIDDLDELGASFISHQHDELSHPAVARVRASGRAVLCWTVRSAAEERAARDHSDNITFEGYPA